MGFISTTLLVLLSSVGCVEAFSMPNANMIYDQSNGKSYAVFSQCANYINAKTTCENEPDTHLVHLETEAEQGWLYQQLTALSLPTQFWMGLELINSVWEWVDNHESTPIVGNHRFTSYSSSGPYRALTSGDVGWTQMHPSNCFRYTCEHTEPVTTTTPVATTTPMATTTPVATTTPLATTTPIATTTTVATTLQTTCSAMRKVSGHITTAALISATHEPDAVSCVRTCFSVNECFAAKFETSTILCSLYKTGSLTFGCGVGAVTTCYLRL